MKRDGVHWSMKALVSLATIALGAALFILIVWVAVQLGLPPSMSWLAAVVGPIVIGGFYFLVSFTTLGKYLWELPPGSLG